jgi:hypothetical protein
MKGYILIKEANPSKEWYYVTIQAFHLKPMAKVVVDERFAIYRSSNFIVKKITSCIDKTITKTEIEKAWSVEAEDYYSFKVGEIKNKRKYKYVYIYKTVRAVISELKLLLEDKVENGWIYNRLYNGRIFSKTFVKCGNAIKKVSYCANGEISVNFLKNETLVNIYNDKKIKYPCIVEFICDTEYNKFDFETIRGKFWYYYKETRFISIERSYFYDGSLFFLFRYIQKYNDNKKLMHGIVSSKMHIVLVCWYGKYVSKNLQKWYKTHWNFVFKKIKCF